MPKKFAIFFPFLTSIIHRKVFMTETLGPGETYEDVCANFESHALYGGCSSADLKIGAGRGPFFSELYWNNFVTRTEKALDRTGRRAEFQSRLHEITAQKKRDGQIISGKKESH
jgi:hypothetical protein